VAIKPDYLRQGKPNALLFRRFAYVDPWVNELIEKNFHSVNSPNCSNSGGFFVHVVRLYWMIDALSKPDEDMLRPITARHGPTTPEAPKAPGRAASLKIDII
jgi:hypothetical protein